MESPSPCWGRRSSSACSSAASPTRPASTPVPSWPHPGPSPTTVVYPAWHGFGFFWPFFGFLFFFLLIGFLVRVFGGWGRGGGYGGPRGGWGPGFAGPGGWDRSRWEAGEVPPPVDTALQNWHRRAHGDGPETPPPATR